MSSVESKLHHIWVAPPENAPALQHVAHAQLMILLRKAEANLPELLTRPEAFDTKRIVSFVLSAAIQGSGSEIQDSDAKIVRDAAISLLQERLKELQPGAQKRIVLPTPSAVNALSADFGGRLAKLERFISAVDKFLPSLRASKDSKSPDTDKTPKVDAEMLVGLLLALIVLRGGQASMAVLQEIFNRIGTQKLAVAGTWAWLDIRIGRGSGAKQLRRVYLDLLTVGVWIRAAKSADELRRTQSTISDIRKCFKALLARLQWGDSEDSRLTLDELCQAQRDWINVHSVPLLASYARGDITHSSLSEGTWLRLLGYVAEAAKETERTADATTDITLRIATDSVTESRRDYQLHAGDMDSDPNSVVVQLRQIMQTPFASWSASLSEFRDKLPGTAEQPSTARLVVGWLAQLKQHPIGTGTQLREGTIRTLRGLIVNRLLTFLPGSIHDIDGEQLSEYYTEIIEDAASYQQKSRIAAGLAQFDRYARTVYESLPQATLPGFDGGGSEASALIISEAEYLHLLSRTKDGSIAYVSSQQAIEDRAFLLLAFRFGLRRTEILGLQLRDIRCANKKGHLLIRDNTAHELKTRNGQRVLPLNGLIGEELSTLEGLVGDRSPDCYLFYDGLPTASQLRDHPVVARVRTLLKPISRDARALHPQNLRHSFASLSAFGMLAADMGLEGSPYFEAWMRDSIAAAKPLFEGLSGNLHRMGARGSALSMALGHVSEDITFKHYTHVLDLLLFHACTVARMLERADDKSLSLRRGEVKAINAVFGYNADRGLTTHGIESVLRSCGEKSPQHLQVFKSHVEQKKAPAAHHLVTIGELLEAAPDESARGFPKRQSERDTVCALLVQLNAAAMQDLAGTISLLHRWIERKMADPDWASFEPKDAERFSRDCSKLMPKVLLEIEHDVFIGRRHHRRRVTSAEFHEELKSGLGKFYIRFQDPRGKDAGLRSRTQSSVTWCCLALVRMPESDASSGQNTNTSTAE